MENSLDSNNYNSDNLLKIKDSLPPIYTSSILFNCAIKNKNNLDYSKEEKHILEKLQKFNGFDPNNYKQLLGLSGIIDVGKKLKIIKNNKENIIKEKNEEMITLEKGNLLKLLEDINLNVLSNRNDIEKYNKEDLEKRLIDITDNLNSVRRKISNIFEMSIVESKKSFRSIEIELEKEEINKKYINFYINIDKKEENEECWEGFLNLKKKRYEKIIITPMTNISEAIFRIKQYLVKCKEYSEMEFKKILNKEELRKIIKKEIIKLFDLSDKNLDEEKIIRPVEILIEKILIPDLNIDEKEFTDMIINPFSGRDVLKGEEISTLERIQLETLGRVFSKVKEKIKKYEVELEKILKEQSSIFVDNLEKEIEENTEKLKEQLKDKEKSLENYGKFIEEIKLYKKMIIEMEL